jgi:hypothetical protein
MIILICVKAKIERKDKTLCSWSCPHISLQTSCGSVRCTVYHEDLKWVTLKNGKEMAKRCRRCRTHYLRSA